MGLDDLKRALEIGGDRLPGSCGGDEPLPCREALAKVYEYLDGELDDVPREQVERHFRVCSECYPHLALETSFRNALRRACQGAEAPARLKERILRLLEDEARTS